MVNCKRVVEADLQHRLKQVKAFYWIHRRMCSMLTSKPISSRSCNIIKALRILGPSIHRRLRLSSGSKLQSCASPSLARPTSTSSSWGHLMSLSLKMVTTWPQRALPQSKDCMVVEAPSNRKRIWMSIILTSQAWCSTPTASSRVRWNTCTTITTTWCTHFAPANRRSHTWPRRQQPQQLPCTTPQLECGRANLWNFRGHVSNWLNHSKNRIHVATWAPQPN